MRSKLLNLSLILTSLVGYLEWGQGQSVFLFQAEAEMLRNALIDPASVLHPLTVLPLAGQIALVWTLFQKSPGKALTYFGMAGIGMLLALMFVVALIDLNVRILASTLPFLVTAGLTIRQHRKRAPRR